MKLHLDDATFVRAPAASVYPRLTAVSDWPDWWPDCVVRPMEARAPTDASDPRRCAVRLGRGRGVRISVRPHGWRADLGVHFEVAGDLDGRAEFWLETRAGGVVVHHLVVASTPRPRPHATLRRYRAAARRGMWALKDVVQSEVRTAEGLHP